MNIHMAKKLPEMVVQLSFMRNIHFESEFRYKIGDTKVLKGISEVSELAHLDSKS